MASIFFESATNLFPGRLTPTTAIAALCVACLAYFILKQLVLPSTKSKHDLPLPPGPKGTPMLGMTAQVLNPGMKHAKLFQEWEVQHGRTGLLLVPTLFRKQIIISDAKAAQALLEKRGPQYSHRAPLYFFDKLQGNGLNLVAMEGGPRVDAIRKLFHEEMAPRAIGQWKHVQTSNAYYTALRMLRVQESGETVANVVEKTQKQLTLRTFCGKLPASTLQNVEQIEAQIDSFATPAISGLLDLFPSLKYIPAWCPGGRYKRDCERYVGLNRKLWNELRDRVRKNQSERPDDAGMWANWIKSNAFARHGFTEDEASFIVGHQLGSNFVPAAIFQVFFLAMLHFPHVFAKAQAELDRVVGRTRLPSMADEQSLPYIRALQLELLRWRPVVPLIQPHVAAKEDEYNGVRIPKGAIMCASLQAMSQDERVYPDPEEFRPERFLNPDGSFTRKDEIAIFGYGKRRCPGGYLAEPILFINLAIFAWALDINLADGETKPPASDVETWYSYVTFVIPPPFKAKITPRDGNVVRLLKAGEADWAELCEVPSVLK